jgi:iron complex outermembrane receptor protein
LVEFAARPHQCREEARLLTIGCNLQTSEPTLSDSAFLVNGRVAVSDIPLSAGAAKLEVSVWTRNLLNEAYAFLKNGGPTPTAPKSALGTFGIYNEPRTFGIDATIRW